MSATHELTFIRYVNDDGEEVPSDAEVTCTAEVGAWCRMHCPDGCEEWNEDHEHELVDYGQCLAVEWFDATDVLECGGAYLGNDVDLSLGPVRVEWSDGWTWYRDKTDVSA